MIAIDSTPAIIACMRDLAEHAVDRLMPDDGTAGAMLAASALNVAHDDVAAFPLWPLTGADEMVAAGLWEFLQGEAPRFTSIDDATRAQRVAMRFATVAIAAAPGLGESPPEVAWLWGAAARLANLLDDSEGATAAKSECAAAAWDATEHAHALTMVGAAAGLTDLPKDPLKAARLIAAAIDKRPASPAPPPVQVGDIIDAKDVPPGTVFTRIDDNAILACDNASNVILRSTKWPLRDFTWRCCVLATGLNDAEADRVAMMTPAEAREWLAQRVAATPIPEHERFIPGGDGVGVC